MNLLWLRASLAALFSVLCLFNPLAAQQSFPRPPIEAYGALPAVEEAIVSPNGTYTAMLTTTGAERVVVVLDQTGKRIKQLVVGDAKVRDIEWVGEEAVLLLRSETGRLPTQYIESKAEFWRGNVIPLDDNRPVISIFAEQRYIANAITGYYGIRRVGDRWIGYFGGFRKGSTSGDRDRMLDRAPALFAVDLATGDAKNIGLPNSWPTVRTWVIDDAGEIGARLELDVQYGNWQVKNGEGATIAKGRQPKGEISILGFDDDASDIIYSVFDEGAKRRRRYAVPVSEGEPRELWSDIAINRYVYQPYSRRILGVRDTQGDLDVSDPAKRSAIAETLDAFSFASNVRIESFSNGFDTLIARTSGNYDSGTWYRVNTADGKRSIVGMERPAVQGPAIGKVSTFTYEAQDGLEIRGILTLPPGREPKDLPAVILPHGGPTAHDVEAFDWWAQAFASRGYAVLQPNFRGSTGRGSAFVDAGDGEWGRKMQTDKSDGLAALAEAGIADPKRACIVGASYGGYAALAGVTLQQGIYRCAVSVNGVTDLKQMLRPMRGMARSVVSRSIEQQFGDDADFNALSPLRWQSAPMRRSCSSTGATIQSFPLSNPP